jgi:hypothetical protein
MNMNIKETSLVIQLQSAVFRIVQWSLPPLLLYRNTNSELSVFNFTTLHWPSLLKLQVSILQLLILVRTFLFHILWTVAIIIFWPFTFHLLWKWLVKLPFWLTKKVKNNPEKSKNWWNNLFCFNFYLRSAKDEPESSPALISWEIIERRMPWGVLFFVGGGFALSDACTKTGKCRLCYHFGTVMNRKH